MTTVGLDPQRRAFGTTEADLLQDLMLFLSPNEQCHCNEENSMHWHQPMILTTVLVGHSNSHCPACQPWATIILYRSSTGVEQSAISRTGCIIAEHFQMRTENISLSLDMSGPLVTNSLFPPICYILVPYWLCKVPLQRSTWQCHLNKYIFDNNNNNNNNNNKVW